MWNNKRDIFVADKSMLPDWKKPCPQCSAKYPQPSISHRKDGTGAWCKGCKQNWVIGEKPGFDPKGWKPENKPEDTALEQLNILAEKVSVQARTLQDVDARLKRIEEMVKNDKVVFYPKDDEIDTSKIPF